MRVRGCDKLLPLFLGRGVHEKTSLHVFFGERI